MTMGERIRQARLEAGLSQRQLAGEMMTRNMLSALENGGANPSIHTLKYLSDKLCKPISYFLGEERSEFPQSDQMERARMLFEKDEYELCLKETAQISQPAFQRERKLLETLCLLEMAEKARKDGKLPYSRELLGMCAKTMEDCPYLKKEIERKWSIAWAMAAVESERAALTEKIPVEDDVLLLRAEGALDRGQYEKAWHLLESAVDRKCSRWNYLRAEVYFRQQDYQNAAECYHRAEDEMPKKTAQRLEICYRELGDYKMAYCYAKKEK